MLASIVCHEVDPLQALFQSSTAAIPLSCSQEATHDLSFDWSQFLEVSTESNDDLCCTASVFNQQPAQPDYVAREEQCIPYSSLSPSRHIASSCQKKQKASPNTQQAQRVTSIPNERPMVTAPLVDSSNANHNNKRRVRFSEVLSIRSHDIILGDHPMCKGGLAIELDWSYGDENMEFELFEQLSRKRQAAKLRLSYIERRERLMEAIGCSGAALLQQEYLMMVGAAAFSQSAMPSCHVLRNSPSVERALMAARGLEDGYECFI